MRTKFDIYVFIINSILTLIRNDFNSIKASYAIWTCRRIPLSLYMKLKFDINIIHCMLATYAVDREFEARSYQAKDFKHTALRSKSKDWLAQNQNNVSGWSDMSTRGLWFQWACPINIQLTNLCSYSIKLLTWWKSSKYQCYCLWLDKTGARTHDLPHSRFDKTGARTHDLPHSRWAS